MKTLDILNKSLKSRPPKTGHSLLLKKIIARSARTAAPPPNHSQSPPSHKILQETLCQLIKVAGRGSGTQINVREIYII